MKKNLTGANGGNGEETKRLRDQAAKGLSLCLCVSVVWLAGCARFSSHQVQTMSDGTSKEQKQIVWTFFDGKSDIAKLRASTTDKTQGLSVGHLNEETSGTNAVDLIERVVGAVVKAAVKP